MSYMKLKYSEIADEREVCVYCQWPANEYKHTFGCCGEIHFENAFLTHEGDVYLESEVDLIDDSEEIRKEKQEQLKLDLSRGK